MSFMEYAELYKFYEGGIHKQQKQASEFWLPIAIQLLSLRVSGESFAAIVIARWWLV